MRRARDIDGDRRTAAQRRASIGNALYNVSVSASYEIDFWGKNRAACAPRGDRGRGRFDREVVTLTTIASVANTYFQVLAAQDRLRIARENLGSADAHPDADPSTARKPAPPPRSTSRSRRALVATSAPRSRCLSRSAPEIHDARGADRPPPEYFTVRGGSMSGIGIPRVTPGLPSELLRQRPDIRRRKRSLRRANASVDSARAAFFPSIQLTGEGGFQSAALRTLFSPRRPSTSRRRADAADLRRLLLQGQLDLQRGRREELLQIYRKTVVSAFADVEAR